MNSKQYITAKEAVMILEVTTKRSLLRYVEKYNITIKKMGPGKETLYLKSDIEQCKINKSDKYITKKNKEKAKEKTEQKKKVIEKRIEKNIETKEKCKKDLEEKDFNPLNEIGQTEFLRIEKLLKENGTYQEMDRSIVLAYSLSYQNYVDAIHQSNNNDNTTTDDFGNLKVHPYFTIADKCLTQMTKLSNMLGISVRARIGIGAKEKPKKGILDFLKDD